MSSTSAGSSPEGSSPDSNPPDSSPPASSPPEGSERGDDAIAELPIEDAIDLHGFRPRDIPNVVEDYLEAAAERGFGEVRLIHGKGTGFQRQRVRQVLEKHPLVVNFADAPATRGHWGATLVWLRPRLPQGPER